MSAELTPEVIDRLTADHYGWLTTWAKYAESAAKFGLTDAMAGYSTRLKIVIDKVWTTPTG
jgi:hypothetical protein